MKTFRDLKKSEIVSAIVLCFVVIAVLGSMLADEAGTFSLSDAHDVAVLTAIVIFVLLIPYLAFLLRSVMRLERAESGEKAQPKRVAADGAAMGEEGKPRPSEPADDPALSASLAADARAGVACDTGADSDDGLADAPDLDGKDGAADQEAVRTRAVDPFELVRGK